MYLRTLQEKIRRRAHQVLPRRNLPNRLFVNTSVSTPSQPKLEEKVMPFYTYKCSEGHTKELNHSLLVEPAPNCDKCKERMKRVPKTVTVTFKGSGFASNDK